MAECFDKNDKNEHLFVMHHTVNSMTENALDCKNVWFVYSGASNHMTSHGEWFSDVRNQKKPSYVETGDDTAHPISQVGKVPLAMQNGRTKYLSYVLGLSWPNQREVSNKT